MSDPPPPYPYPSAPPLEKSPYVCGCILPESGKHEPECPKFPEPCPNGCEVGSVERWRMEQHRSVCPLEPVACEMKEFGCSVVVPRRELATHMKESELQHLTAMTALNLRLTRQLQQDSAERDRNIDQLHQEIADQKKEIKKIQTLLNPQQAQRKTSNLAVSIREIPLGTKKIGHSEFTITHQNYEHLKTSSGETESQDYFVGKLEYIFKVMVRYNSFLKSIGVFVCLKGARSDTLELPVAAQVECELLSKFKHTLLSSVRNASIMWTEETIGKYGVVDSNFKKFTDIDKENLANNCLRFRFSIAWFAVSEADVRVI